MDLVILLKHNYITLLLPGHEAVPGVLQGRGREAVDRLPHHPLHRQAAQGLRSIAGVLLTLARTTASGGIYKCKRQGCCEAQCEALWQLVLSVGQGTEAAHPLYEAPTSCRPCKAPPLVVCGIIQQHVLSA